MGADCSKIQEHTCAQTSGSNNWFKLFPAISKNSPPVMSTNNYGNGKNTQVVPRGTSICFGKAAY